MTSLYDKNNFIAKDTGKSKADKGLSRLLFLQNCVNDLTFVQVQ